MMRCIEFSPSIYRIPSYNSGEIPFMVCIIQARLDGMLEIEVERHNDKACPV